MVLDAAFFALAVPAVLLAAVSKGGFGSGASFVATPILALTMDPRLALGFLLPLLIVMDIATLRPFWRLWDSREAVVLIASGVPGILVGVALFSVANADVFRFLIGVVALGFVGYQLAQSRGWIRVGRRRVGPAAGLVTGLVAGFTSFVSHAGGPAVAVYLLSKGVSKTVYQATTVIVFAALNVMKAAPYAMLGAFTPETLWANLLMVPVALIGTWAGVKAHWMVPDRWFFAITYVLLTLAGTKLIWDALT